MVLGMNDGQDIYYSRQNLSSKLQTRDIPGEHVTFEIQRNPDGKMSAMNVRPLGDEKETFQPDRTFVPGKGQELLAKGFSAKGSGGFTEEDRSRDWTCTGCGE